MDSLIADFPPDGVVATKNIVHIDFVDFFAGYRTVLA